MRQLSRVDGLAGRAIIDADILAVAALCGLLGTRIVRSGDSHIV